MKRFIMSLSMLVLLVAAVTAGAQSPKQEAEQARQEAEAARQEAQADREALREQLAAAREQLKEAARQVADLSRQMGERSGEAFVYEFMSDEDRGVIGVVLTRDGEDLKIASVTPGGPAEEAGVEPGDVLVAVNGEPVETGDGKGVRGAPEGLRDLEAGDTVTLTLSGDAGEREVTVEAGRHGMMNWGPAMRELRELKMHAPRAPHPPSVPDMPHLDEEIRHKVHRAMDAIHVNVNRGWGRVELAPLNEELGRYFGADEGVLVVSAPEDNPLGLKGGDVILRIDGREPSDPGHAFRMARSYGVGEKLEVEILRDGDRRTLTHEIDDEADRELGWNPHGAPEAFAFGFASP